MKNTHSCNSNTFSVGIPSRLVFQQKKVAPAHYPAATPCVAPKSRSKKYESAWNSIFIAYFKMKYLIKMLNIKKILNIKNMLHLGRH